MRCHGNGSRHAANLSSFLVCTTVDSRSWNSVHRLPHVLVLEFAHLNINLSLSLLINCSIYSELNLLLNVSLDLLHLLSVSKNIVVLRNCRWWCSILGLNFHSLSGFVTSWSSNFFFDFSKSWLIHSCFHQRLAFIHHAIHSIVAVVHLAFSLFHHPFILCVHHLLSLLFTIDFLKLFGVISFEVRLVNSLVLTFTIIKSCAFDNGTNEFSKSMTTDLAVDRNHVIHINIDVCFSHWIQLFHNGQKSVKTFNSFNRFFWNFFLVN